MSNELLIEAGVYETRVAALEDGRVVELHVERRGDGLRVGDIFKGRVSRVIPGIQAAFVDIGSDRHAYLFAGERQSRPEADGEVVRQGEQILVQVAKEPLPGKGARISARLSLAGRFVVFLPGNGGIGVSRQISDLQTREELEEQLTVALRESEGLIVRTAAAGRPVADLLTEIAMLREVWTEVQQRAAEATAPALVHRELELARRSIRDLLGPGDGEVWVEGEDAFEEIRRYLEIVDPDGLERLRRPSRGPALFDRFGVSRAWKQAMRDRVWLRSGGFLVIDPTEALVAIDVNTGRHTEGVELEATARTTNLEAAEEIARQVRLRDLSGIIVIDFIDMIQPRHREELMEQLQAALAQDRHRTQISEMSDFGLVALTRKRTRSDLLRQLTEPCPCCEGRGRVESALTVSLEILRALRQGPGSGSGRCLVEVHPRVRQFLERDHRELFAAMREQVAGDLVVQSNAELPVERFTIRRVEGADAP